jgi:hypothetical protein
VTLAAGALWGFVGMSTGALLARHAGRDRRIAPRRRWLATAPGAVAVASAMTVIGLSACGSVPALPTAAAAPRGGDDRAASSSTTTSTAPPTTVAATSAPSGGATVHTTAPRSSRVAAKTTSAAAPAAANTGAAAANSGWAPAAPGVYRYDTTGSTSSLLGTKSFPRVTTLTIDAPTGARQHSVRQLEASDGDGFVIEQILDYQPGGVAVVQQRLAMTQSGNKTVRTLNAAAAPVAIPVGAPVGSHREFDLTGSKIAGHEVVDILQSGSVPVGGQTVGAVLVRTMLTISGSVSGTIQLDQWWAPSARVPVKEHLSGTIHSGLVTVKTTYDATLQKLTAD